MTQNATKGKRQFAAIANSQRLRAARMFASGHMSARTSMIKYDQILWSNMNVQICAYTYGIRYINISIQYTAHTHKYTSNMHINHRKPNWSAICLYFGIDCGRMVLVRTPQRAWLKLRHVTLGPAAGWNWTQKNISGYNNGCERSWTISLSFGNWIRNLRANRLQHVGMFAVQCSYQDCIQNAREFPWFVCWDDSIYSECLKHLWDLVGVSVSCLHFSRRSSAPKMAGSGA